MFLGLIFSFPIPRPPRPFLRLFILLGLVSAKVDAAARVWANSDISARISDTVRSHCTHFCSLDMDAAILADIIALIKIDLGDLLSGLDVHILTDIRARLASLGIKLNTHVKHPLGLDLRAILSDVVSECKHAQPTILANFKLAFRA